MTDDEFKSFDIFMVLVVCCLLAIAIILAIRL
jgi:hypothetical protein